MNDADETPLAANLRRLRRVRGLAVVELARRASIARATLTQLEAGRGNPTLETLYALANALDVSLAELIAVPPVAPPPHVVRRGDGTPVMGEAVQAWLLDTVIGTDGSTEIYDFTLHARAAQHSAPHPVGTREHLHLYTGHIRVGPTSAPIELRPGDFASFAADQDHLYQQRGNGRVSGVLIITRDQGHDRPSSPTKTTQLHRDARP